ncbi:hypothetical protein LT493_25860 [Streptomyces tricolor]|nr:hypothetical protein [Streptomyces tricolor]
MLDAWGSGAAAVVAGPPTADPARRRAARAPGRPETVGESAVRPVSGALPATGGVWGGPDAPGRQSADRAGHIGLALFPVATAREPRTGTGRLSGRCLPSPSPGPALPPVVAAGRTPHTRTRLAALVNTRGPWSSGPSTARAPLVPGPYPSLLSTAPATTAPGGPPPRAADRVARTLPVPAGGRPGPRPAER